MGWYHPYEERIRHPEKGFINWEYIVNHPEQIPNIYCAINRDPILKRILKERMLIDKTIRDLFLSFFQSFKNENIIYNKKL